MGKRGPGTCGRCGSPDVVRIVYGLPTAGTFERAERGEVELGGCIVFEGRPERRCRACGATWSPGAGWREGRREGAADEAPDEE